MNVERFDLDYFLPMNAKILSNYTTLEKVLVIVNIALFAASFQCQDVDSEVSTALIYIMFAIAYFVATTTCLTGASSIKGMFTPGQNGSARQEESVQNDCDISLSNSSKSASKGATKSNGIPTNKKPAMKKTPAALLKTEKKELQQNNFY